MNNQNPDKKLLDKMFNMVLDGIHLTVYQILFNPTIKQKKQFWCDNCDGFHKTKNCPQKQHGNSRKTKNYITEQSPS